MQSGMMNFENALRGTEIDCMDFNDAMDLRDARDAMDVDRRWA